MLGRAGAALPAAAFLRRSGCKWADNGGGGLSVRVCGSVCVCSAALRSPVCAVPAGAQGGDGGGTAESRAGEPAVALRKRRDALETKHRLFIVWEMGGFHGVPWASGVSNVRHSQQRGFAQVTLSGMRSVGSDARANGQKPFGLMNRGAFQYIKTCREDGASLFTRECSDRTRGSRFKLTGSAFRLDARTKVFTVVGEVL